MVDGLGDLKNSCSFNLKHKLFNKFHQLSSVSFYTCVQYRRKAFWVAKQVLQLGMGDAFDDWLIEKIQLLRKGSVIASGVKRVEQVIF